MDTSKLSPAEIRKLVFGARTALNRVTRTDLHELFSFTFDEKDRLDIADFCAKSGYSVQDLREKGAKAEERGALLKRNKKPYEIVKGRNVWVFRSIKIGWDTIDGTMPSYSFDEKLRYCSGPVTNNKLNSAFEACLFAAVRLDMGWLQVDQISALAVYELQLNSPGAAMVRHALCWSGLQHGHSSIRAEDCDSIAEAFHQATKSKFRGERNLPLEDVADYCFTGFPQLGWSTITAHICCDGVYNIRKGETGLEGGFVNVAHLLQEQTLEEQVNELLGLGPAMKGSTCSNGKQCLHNRHERMVVLDRLPPTLILVLPRGVQYGDPMASDIFDDLNLTYIQAKHEEKIRYRLVGAIFDRHDYFITKWLSYRTDDPSSPFLQFDRTLGANVVPAQSWWAKDDQASPRLLFFRMYG